MKWALQIDTSPGGFLQLHLGQHSPWLVQGDNFGLLLGWADFVLDVVVSAWKGGNLAELAEHPDTLVEHPNQRYNSEYAISHPPCHAF